MSLRKNCGETLVEVQKWIKMTVVVFNALNSFVVAEDRFNRVIQLWKLIISDGMKDSRG